MGLFCFSLMKDSIHGPSSPGSVFIVFFLLYPKNRNIREVEVEEDPRINTKRAWA